MTSPITRRRQARLERRLRIGDRYFHPEMPASSHGLWSGYNYWGCQCDICLEAGKQYYRDAKQRKEERRRVLAADTPVRVPRPVICAGALALAPPPPRLPVICTAEFTLAPPPPRDPVDTFEWAPPPMTPTTRGMVRDVEHLRQICRAYYEPEIVYPDRTAPDRERRRAGNVAVTVVPNGTVIFIAEQEESDVPPTFLAARAKGIPKAKGGRGGRRTPTSTGDIVDALRKLKADLTRDGNGHWRVVGPGGRGYSFPSSPNGGKRSVQNTVADLRRLGFAI